MSLSRVTPLCRDPWWTPTGVRQRMVKEAVQGEEGSRQDACEPLVSHHAQGASMTPDAFSEQ